MTKTSLGPGHCQDLAIGCRDEMSAYEIRDICESMVFYSGLNRYVGDRRFCICFEARQTVVEVCPLV